MKRVAICVAALVIFGVTGCPEKGKSKGKDGSEMKVTAPSDTTIEKGGSETLTVKVEREKFNDAVDVKIEDLPEGVKAKKSSITIDKGDKEGTFTITADKDAKPGKGTAKVTFKSGDKEKTLNFQVRVKE